MVVFRQGERSELTAEGRGQWLQYNAPILIEISSLKYDWETELSGTGSTGRVEFRVFRVLPLYILNNDIGTEALRLRP